MYGKVAAIYKHNGSVISYTFDMMGRRISKSTDGVQTWYVLDARGM